MKPIKETKLGHWLKDNFPSVLATVGEVLPDKGALGIIRNIIRKDPAISPEQLAEIEAKLMEFERDIFEIEVRDRERASNMNVLLNQSENASWLAKNTASIIALAYTAFNFVIYYQVLSGSFKANENIAILIVNSITNIAMLIVGFYFGSSQERGRWQSKVRDLWPKEDLPMKKKAA